MEDIASSWSGVSKHPGSHDFHSESFRIVSSQEIRSDLGDGIWGCRMETTFFVDPVFRFLVCRDPAEDFRRSTDMDDRRIILILFHQQMDGLQQSAGTQDIRIQCIDRCRKTRQRIGLRRQMEDIVRLDLLDHRDQRHLVIEIRILEINAILPIYSVQKVFHIVQRAAPAADAVDIPIGIL